MTTEHEHDNIRRIDNGSIDYGFYQNQGHAERSLQAYALFGLFSNWLRSIALRAADQRSRPAQGQHIYILNGSTA